jgi:hypothetical protein
MLPDEWAAKGRCPICGAGPLHLKPGLEVADQLACARCGTAFEVEDGGPHIRLTHLPAETHAAPDGAWRTGSEARAWVRGLVAKGSAGGVTEPARDFAPHPDPLPEAERGNLDDAEPLPSPGESPTGVLREGAGGEGESKPPSLPPSESPPQSLIPEPSIPPAALAKAKELLALRQTAPQIRAILQREWTLEQVQAVMAEVERLEAQNRARQMRLGWLTITGAALVLLVVGGLALNAMLGSRGAALPGGAGQTNASGAPGAAGPGGAIVQPTQTNSPFIDPKNLPAPLQTLIPPGVQILNPPTPFVKKGDGPPAKACPLSEEEAARVFGGQASDWHREAESNGWTMITVGEAATISVPANMTAGYMTFGDSLKITQVNGPATIENVYMIALSCE